MAPGPSPITPRGNLVWTSDTSVGKSGWRLCAPPAPLPGSTLATMPNQTLATMPGPPAPAAAPTSAPQSGPWKVLEGACTVVGGCVQSSNYTDGYNDMEHCVITP